MAEKWNKFFVLGTKVKREVISKKLSDENNISERCKVYGWL